MGMALDEPHGNEQPLQVNGIGVLIEDTIKPYIGDTTIDYIKDRSGEGFVIQGPGTAC